MVGVMTEKQPLLLNVPTLNFYHGYCVGYTYYNFLAKPHVGFHVISSKDKVVLHCFLNGNYTHSQCLLPSIYYPAISAVSPSESVTFVRPKAIPSIPQTNLLHWPEHPFGNHAYDA